jgi:L-rhamnonate dehydratase
MTELSPFTVHELPFPDGASGACRITRVETIAIGPPGTPPAKGRGRPLITPVTSLFPNDSMGRGEALAGLPPGRVWAVLVRVWDSEGRCGIGSAGFGNAAAAKVVEDHLAGLVVGRDPFDVELIWELMYRSTINFGRRGVVVQALSAVDIAIWDLIGHILEKPLFKLLGGRTRERIRVYASRLYATEDLDALAAEASSFAAQGFTGVKQRLAYGPADGVAGMRKNLRLAQTVSEAIGPDVDHMVDAYMGWDRTYTIRMIRMLEDAGIRLGWVEEPVIPDDVAGYAAIRRAVSTPIAGGEHEFTRYGFRQLLEREAVDVLQPDLNRMGGVTEARKVWALASAFGVPVVPHGGQMHNYHMVMASLSSPMAEHFIRPARGTVPDEDELFYLLFPEEPDAVDGHVDLSDDAPGLGLTLDSAVVAALKVDA